MKWRNQCQGSNHEHGAKASAIASKLNGGSQWHLQYQKAWRPENGVSVKASAAIMAK